MISVRTVSSQTNVDLSSIVVSNTLTCNIHDKIHDKILYIQITVGSVNNVVDDYLHKVAQAIAACDCPSVAEAVMAEPFS